MLTVRIPVELSVVPVAADQAAEILPTITSELTACHGNRSNPIDQTDEPR
jgi:hypothetical protein